MRRRARGAHPVADAAALGTFRGTVSVESASRDQDCMLAAWLVGTEHEDDRAAGEVCIFEIDAAAVGETTAARWA